MRDTPPSTLCRGSRQSLRRARAGSAVSCPPWDPACQRGLLASWLPGFLLATRLVFWPDQDTQGPLQRGSRSSDCNSLPPPPALEVARGDGAYQHLGAFGNTKGMVTLRTERRRQCVWCQGPGLIHAAAHSRGQANTHTHTHTFVARAANLHKLLHLHLDLLWCRLGRGFFCFLGSSPGPVNRHRCLAPPPPTKAEHPGARASALGVEGED